MKYLRVKDLIRILQTKDPNLALTITHAGKDHQYGITDENIEEIADAYFGNDPEAEDAFPNEEKFLNIGYT